jgi:hypothetical protein
VLIAQERFKEAKTQLDAARFGFDKLLERQLLAFADHAAESTPAAATTFGGHSNWREQTS